MYACLYVPGLKPWTLYNIGMIRNNDTDHAMQRNVTMGVVITDVALQIVQDAAMDRHECAAN